MTIEERQLEVEKIYSEAKQIMLSKGKSYAGTGQDSLANFKRNAERLGMSKYQIWAVYFNKHIDSINSAIAANPDNPVDFSESIRGRVIDVINYATILECLLLEQTNSLNK